MIHQGQAHEDSTASQGVRKMAKDLAVLQDWDEVAGLRQKM